jgi:hypothetical protein
LNHVCVFFFFLVKENVYFKGKLEMCVLVNGQHYKGYLKLFSNAV